MKKRVGILIGICISMFLFSFWIATVSINTVFQNNKKYKTAIVNTNKVNKTEVLDSEKIKENEKVHIKNINIKSIYNDNNDNNNFLGKDMLVKELILKDKQGKSLNIVGKNKKDLKNKEVMYKDKLYSLDTEDTNNLVLSNIKFEKQYILKIDDASIAVYKADEAGVLTKVKDTKYKTQDLKLRDIDKKLFEKNKMQIDSDSIESVEDALSDFKS